MAEAEVAEAEAGWGWDGNFSWIELSGFVWFLVIWQDPANWPTHPPNHPPIGGMYQQIINLQTELNYLD